jgi:hypothetical protein
LSRKFKSLFVARPFKSCFCDIDSNFISAYAPNARVGNNFTQKEFFMSFTIIASALNLRCLKETKRFVEESPLNDAFLKPVDPKYIGRSVLFDLMAASGAAAAVAAYYAPFSVMAQSAIIGLASTVGLAVTLPATYILLGIAGFAAIAFVVTYALSYPNTNKGSDESDPAHRVNESPRSDHVEKTSSEQLQAGTP